METLPKSETWMTQTKGGSHQQEYLAKFGSRPDIKAQKIKNPFIFWLPAGTCCRIWGFLKKNSKAGEFGPFFHENHDFQVVIMQKIAKENTGAKKKRNPEKRTKKKGRMKLTDNNYMGIGLPLHKSISNHSTKRFRWNTFWMKYSCQIVWNSVWAFKVNWDIVPSKRASTGNGF